MKIITGRGRGRGSRHALVVTIGATAFVTLGAGLGIAATSVTRDTTEVRLRVLQSSFQDGFDSGWHTHPGAVIVQVTSGKLKIYRANCQVVVVQPGETFLEVPFTPLRAVATEPTTWTTTQILPSADAPSTNVASPC